MKAMFALIIFDILLFEGSSMLALAHRGTLSERVKILVKNLNSVRLLLTYKLMRFRMVFDFF